tara:strand:+ start:3778 stop:4641 length:864 start_codon:yes stop_codon:yes gene_type:complete
MFRYRVCNLNILSEVQIPIFEIEKKSFNKDIQITIKNNYPNQDFGDYDTVFSNDSVYYKSKPGLIFEILNNSDIIIYISNEIDKGKIWELLIGLPLGYALRKKGFMVMHGSSVSMNGQAVCIVGSSGLGKSTLALSLVEKGFKFLTEDLCVIKDGIIHFYSQWVKIDKNLKNKIKIDSNEHVQLSFDSRERNLIKIKKENCSENATPKAIYFPVISDNKNIEQMKNDEIFKFLFANSYRIKDDEESDLKMIANTIKSFDCYYFQRNINSPINDNIDFLLSHIESILD